MSALVSQVITEAKQAFPDLAFEGSGFLPELRILESLDLPDSDGEPMENERERIQIDLALACLDYH